METYELELKEIVNLWDMGSIHVGRKIPIMIHPDNPKDIMLML